MKNRYPEWYLTEDDEGHVDTHALVKFFLSPLFEVVFYVFALATAVRLSVNASSVEQVLVGTGSLRDISGVLVFVGITTLLHVLNRRAVFIQRKAAARSRERVREDLLDAGSDLKEFVRTMPPESFLEIVGRLHVRADNLLRVLLDSDEPIQGATIRLALRTVLGYVAEAARTFDDKTTERYHANIMTYHSPNEIEQDVIAEALQNRLVFERDTSSVRRSRGVLDLRLDLAISTSNEGGDEPKEDPSLSPFLLAIPPQVQEPDGRCRFYTLPGAPLAWARKSADQYTDVDALLDWYDEECVRDDAIKAQLSDYFTHKDSGIGSFAAYALVFNEQDYRQRTDEAIQADESVYPLITDPDNKEVPIGVLNIHRASAGILRGDPQAGPYFTRATRSLRVICTHLLYLLRETENRKYGTWRNLLPDNIDEEDDQRNRHRIGENG